MNIRKATLGDAQAIRELVYSLSDYYLEDRDAPIPPWFLKTLELAEFERRLMSPEFTNFVHLENKEIVGYISLQGPGHLYHLFVSEKFQGKGIARRLWEHVIDGSGSERYTVRSSLSAVPVYRRFGFVNSAPAASKDGIGYQPMEIRQLNSGNLGGKKTGASTEVQDDQVSN